MDIKNLRKLALSKIKNLPAPKANDPIEALNQLSWPEPDNVHASQKVIALANVDIDSEWCFGRAALSVAYIEHYFKGTKIQCAEILEDWFRNIMLDNMSLPPKKSEIEELLMYEDPHIIPVINGIQFDSLSTQIGFNIVHPKIEVFPAWECLLNSYLVAEANLEKDLLKKLSTLKLAEALCANVLVAENKFSVYLALDLMTEAKIEIEKAITKRPTLYCLLLHSYFWNETNSYEQAKKTYPLEVIKYAQKKLNLLQN